MTTIVHDGTAVIRGWRQEEDYTISLGLQKQQPVSGTSSSNITINDLTYAIETAASTLTLQDVNVTTALTNPPVSLQSVTPAVCSVDQGGIVTGVAAGACTIEALGQTGKRRISQTITSTGSGSAYEQTGIVAGSLRKYLQDQQLAALAGVTPGSAAQRAHTTVYTDGFGNSGSTVNTSNFIRAQAQSGFHPFQLDLLDEIMVGAFGSAQWRAWITPHHFLTWEGHGSASIAGQRVSISGEVVVRYSATAWTGNLCKLFPANITTYLPSTRTTKSHIAVWGRLYNTYDVGADYRWVMPGTFGSEAEFPVSDSRRAYQKIKSGSPLMVNGGDSGSPVWVGVKEGANAHATLVPVGITSWLGQLGTSIFGGTVLAAVQAAVDTLNASGPYTVQTVDLSGFTSYP